MIHEIIAETANFGSSTTVKGTLKGQTVDHLQFCILNKSATNPYDAAAAALSTVIATYRQSENEQVKEIVNCNMKALALYADFMAGKSLLASDLDMVSVALEIGGYNFKGEQELTVSHKCTDTVDAAHTISLDGLRQSDGLVSRPLKYESITVDTTGIKVPRCLGIFGIHTPDGRTYKLTDSDGNYTTSDYRAKARAQSFGHMEAEQEFTWAWHDRTGQGQNVYIKPSVATEFLIKTLA